MSENKSLSEGDVSSSSQPDVHTSNKKVKTALPGREKVDFIQPQKSRYAVQAMPGSLKVDARKKSGRGITALIVVFIAIFLGLGGFVIWMYGDSLGISVPNLSFQQKDQEEDISQKTDEEISKMNEDINVNTESISGLTEKVGGLSDDADFLEKKADHAEDIQNIEIFLKKTDSDGDGISDYDEVTVFETDPENEDTDGDGFKDGEEISAGFNPSGDGELVLKNQEKDDSSETGTISLGSYVGAFSLTDVEVSSNDIKLELSEDNAVSGSFTFEYEGSPYRVELTGVSEKDEEGSIRMVLDSSMISGSEKEGFKATFLLSEDSETKELSGVVEFTEIERDFLKSQKGQISFKLVSESAPAADVEAVDAVESEEETIESGSPISVPSSLQ